MAQRSIYVAPKVFDYDKLDATRCYPAPVSDKKRFLKKVVENSMQIHHSFLCPEEYNTKNDFSILFPQTKSSAINRTVKNNKANYYIHTDIYMNYHAHRDATERKIDDVLRRHPDISAQALRATLNSVMSQEYGRTQKQIDEACTIVLPMGEETLTLDYFRTICFVLLIEDELQKDVVGTRLMTWCRNFKQWYADYLDKHLAMKGAIFEAIGIPKQDAHKPAIDYIDDIWHYNKYDERSTKADQIDYGKSPAISSKLWTKPSSVKELKTNDIVLYVNGDDAQVLCSSVFNQFDSPTPKEKVRANELETFIYMAGDASKGKPHFKLIKRETNKAPTAWWSGATKRCKIQLTTSVIKIFNRLITPNQARAISSEEYAADMEDARAAAAMLIPEAGTADEQQPETDEEDYDEYGEPRKRVRDEWADVADGLELRPEKRMCV